MTGCAAVVDNQVELIEELIRRARQRLVLNETLGQLAFAAAVTAGGFVLILIAGTRFLEWWTLTIFAAIGLGIGVWRVVRRAPGQYATAVLLDENARLHDALSTALHFSRSSEGSANFRESQRQQAQGAAAEVRLDRAVPFVFPRSLYAMAALCVLASALIALRYGIAHKLNLRAPLTQLLFEDQSIRDAKRAKALYPKSKTWMDEAQSLLSKLGMTQNPNEPTPGDQQEALDKAIDDALQGNTNPGMQSQKGNGQGSKSGQTKSGDTGNEAQNGDPIDNPDQQAANDQSGQEGANPQAGQQGSKSMSGKTGNRSNQESLLSRLKDAVSNMLSKSGQQENSSSQKNEQSAKSDNQNGQKGQAGKGAQEKGESQSDADAEPDSDAQSGQQSQGKLNSPNQSPAQGGSGIGSQNGSKEIKEAAQLKAMGKISEIIGQRAATVSGETSVEVQSGNQKLHTQYSNTSATHGETDSDLTRDEIPLALQAYVQQYFAEVRKSGGNGKPKPAPQPAPQH